MYLLVVSAVIFAETKIILKDTANLEFYKDGNGHVKV